MVKEEAGEGEVEVGRSRRQGKMQKENRWGGEREGELEGSRRGVGGRRRGSLSLFTTWDEAGSQLSCFYYSLLRCLLSKKRCSELWCLKNEAKHPVTFCSRCLFFFSSLLVCLFSGICKFAQSCLFG